jgi:hypothetical protein
MTTNQQNDPTEASSQQPGVSSEETIRRLEEFPVEVLQAALLVLQMRQKRPAHLNSPAS